MIQALNEFAESQHSLTPQELGSQGASTQLAQPRYPQSLPGQMPFVDENLSLIGSVQKNQTMVDSELRYATENLNSPQSPNQDYSYGEDSSFEEDMPGKQGVISEHSYQNERTTSAAQSSAATPNTVNQCREKTKQIGGLLLAMSGHPVPPPYGKPHYTPTTSKHKKSQREKKNTGSSLASSKGRKMPLIMNDSSSIDKEDVQVIGRMEDTIKAYFPAKSQVKRFKHNIKKLRSTSVVTQRLLPAHCQSQAVLNQNMPQSPTKTNLYSHLEETDITASDEKQYYRVMDMPSRRSTKQAAMMIAQQNMYVAIPGGGMREGRTLNQERASNILKELPPLKRQSSQGAKRKSKGSLRDGTSTLAQAGRLQISSNRLNSLKPASSVTKFPQSLKQKVIPDETKRFKISAGSALNACRAQSGRRVPRNMESETTTNSSPLPGSGQEPRLILLSHSSEKQVKPRLMPAGSGATDQEDGRLTERGRSSPITPPTASETASGSAVGKLEVVKEKPAQQRKDFQKRNLEHLKAIMEKKKQEVMLIEEERQKMKETREKLKKMILQRAERRKKEKEDLEMSRLESLEETKRTPQKRQS